VIPDLGRKPARRSLARKGCKMKGITSTMYSTIIEREGNFPFETNAVVRSSGVRFIRAFRSVFAFAEPHVREAIYASAHRVLQTFLGSERPTLEQEYFSSAAIEPDLTLRHQGGNDRNRSTHEKH
jgi:hypothetical protein